MIQYDNPTFLRLVLLIPSWTIVGPVGPGDSNWNQQEMIQSIGIIEFDDFSIFVPFFWGWTQREMDHFNGKIMKKHVLIDRLVWRPLMTMVSLLEWSSTPRGPSRKVWCRYLLKLCWEHLLKTHGILYFYKCYLRTATLTNS